MCQALVGDSSGSRCSSLAGPFQPARREPNTMVQFGNPAREPQGPLAQRARGCRHDCDSVGRLQGGDARSSSYSLRARLDIRTTAGAWLAVADRLRPAPQTVADRADRELNTICRWPHGGRRHGTWSAIRVAGGLT
jgi:hypothetical protein